MIEDVDELTSEQKKALADRDRRIANARASLSAAVPRSFFGSWLSQNGSTCFPKGKIQFKICVNLFSGM